MKRNFCIGSEFLYYKIYTGVKTTDIILLEKLYPIIQELKAKNIISKWFFIRYKDDCEHLRIRFYSEKTKNISIIIAALYPVLNQLLLQDIIWKIQTDTYQREIERYGETTIEDSETLFGHDSEMMLKYISIKNAFTNSETQLLFSFLAIDSFLNAFSLTNTAKLEIMEDLQAAFKKECNADKTLKKELDRHYRILSPEINNVLNGSSQNQFPEIFQIIRQKQKQSHPTICVIQEKLQIPLAGFLKSHIHMTINRQYTSQQRKYETIIYDHLYRYYKKVEFRSETVPSLNRIINDNFFEKT